TGRGLVGVAAVNGKVYAIGGTPDQSNGPATVEEYDPATNSWTNCAGLSSTGCAPMPTARYALGVATATNGKIYAMGGMVANAVEEYDPATNSWATKAPMPTGRAYLGVVAAPNGKLYAIGGVDPGGSSSPPSVFAKVEQYDPATNTWVSCPAMPTARAELGVAAADNGKLYAIGGINGTGATLATVEQFDLGIVPP